MTPRDREILASIAESFRRVDDYVERAGSAWVEDGMALWADRLLEALAAAGIETGLVVRAPGAALDAQPRTVVHAQRLERQCEHHRVPQQRLQVDQVGLEHADLELLIRIDAADRGGGKELQEPDGRNAVAAPDVVE